MKEEFTNQIFRCSFDVQEMVEDDKSAIIPTNESAAILDLCFGLVDAATPPMKFYCACLRGDDKKGQVDQENQQVDKYARCTSATMETQAYGASWSLTLYSRAGRLFVRDAPSNSLPALKIDRHATLDVRLRRLSSTNGSR